MSSEWSAWKTDERSGQQYIQRQDATGAWETKWLSQVQREHAEAETTAPQGGPTTPRSNPAAPAEASYGDYHSPQSNSHNSTPTQTFDQRFNSGYYTQSDTAQSSSSAYALSSAGQSNNAQTAYAAQAGSNAAISQSNPDDLVVSTQDENEAETLDPSFRRVRNRDQREFYKPGRVFAVLWTEPTSRSATDDMRGAFTEVNYGQAAYTEVRRFIVIFPHRLHSLCVPIASYRQQGTVNRPDAQHHSIAFGGSYPPGPLHNETLDKHPIKIKLETGETLNNHSRINFSKLYTVEHNVRVKHIGKVDDDWLNTAVYYTRQSSMSSE